MSMPRLPSSRRVSVDTSAYFAAADRREPDYAAARVILDRLAAELRFLFTTNFIAAESHALFLTRAGRGPALRFLQRLDTSTTTIVRVSARDERRAREILAQYDDKDFSLTDATSFAVMERLRISRAFTFDCNFSQYGFTILTP